MTKQRADDRHQARSGTESAARRRRVLVIHHDPGFREALATSLRFAGFEVRHVTSGPGGLAATTDWMPHLVVLNATPNLGRSRVVLRLREHNTLLPVVYLVAWGHVPDDLPRLTSERDSYVTRPFSLNEIVSRVRVMMPPRAGVLRYADLELDEENRTARRSGRLISLSAVEFTLLRHLMVNAGRVLSVSHVLEHVWGNHLPKDVRIVTSHIDRLRRKIDKTGQPLIHAVREKGYRLGHEPKRATRDG